MEAVLIKPMVHTFVHARLGFLVQIAKQRHVQLHPVLMVVPALTTRTVLTLVHVQLGIPVLIVK